MPGKPVDRALETQDRVEPVERAAAQLELRIEQLEMKRKQERFFWLFGCAALFNILVTSLAPGGAAVICLLFTLIGLIAAARWLEVPWITPNLQRWLDGLFRRSPDKNETE